MDTIGLQFGERLAAEGTLGNATYNEFMRLIAGLHDWAAFEHTGEGGHGDITAESAIIADDVEIGGDLKVSGTFRIQEGTDDVTSPSVWTLNPGPDEPTGFLPAQNRVLRLSNLEGAVKGGLPTTNSILKISFVVTDGWTWNFGSAGLADSVILTGIDELDATDIDATDVTATTVNATDVNADDIDVTGAITADTVDSTTGYTEMGRTAPQGVWTDVAFNAANFTASGTMAWTVASGDQNTYTYMLIGNTMFLSFKISTSTVVAPLSTTLRLAIPGGYVVATDYTTSGGLDYNQGAWLKGCCEVASGEAYVRLFTQGFGSANWAASTDLTYLQGQIIFEVM
jgi:hypothetical protein